MTTVELQDSLEQKLRVTGLSDAVNGDLSQVLDFPDGFFVEVVLNDASKLQDAERTLAEFSEELKKTGMQVDGLVRALWKVGKVEFVGSARSAAGAIRAAVRFKAPLQSGAREQEVYVDVTLTALDRLREKLGIKTGRVGWSPENADVDLNSLEDVVRQFLELQLSEGGTSYWDPIRFPKQELTPAAMEYLVR